MNIVIVNDLSGAMRATLADFLAANEFSADESSSIASRVAAGQIVTLGGGAAPTFSIFRDFSERNL